MPHPQNVFGRDHHDVSWQRHSARIIRTPIGTLIPWDEKAISGKPAERRRAAMALAAAVEPKAKVELISTDPIPSGNTSKRGMDTDIAAYRSASAHFRNALDLPEPQNAVPRSLNERATSTGRWLRCLGVSLGELVVGDGPDALNAAAGTQEQSGTRQRDERHEERVFDQVLALLVIPEVRNVVHSRSPSSPNNNSINATTSRYRRRSGCYLARPT